VAVLLNVAGRLLAENLGLLFVDMTGTAFAALLLGPWWAAAVAATTTIVNGGFFEIYFAFGVVNIAGAIAWGYLGRAVDIRHRVFGARPASLGVLLMWTIVFWLVGAVVCGLASSGVKLVLFPQIGRPLVLGDFYEQIAKLLSDRLGGPAPATLILLAGDLVRDLLDKAIVVPAAMLLVLITRISPTLAAGLTHTRLSERLRTDIISIFVFAVMFSAYILLAQLIKPVLSYPGGERAVAWLKSPGIVALLYAPLVVAVLAFVLLTYRPADAYSRHLETLRRFRRYAFVCMLGTGDKAASLQAAQGLQPLSVGISLWSLRGVIDERLGVPLSVFVIFLAIAIYLIVVRTVYPRLRMVANDIGTLNGWSRIDAGQREHSAMLELFCATLSSYVSRVRTEQLVRNDLNYVLGFATGRRPSRLAQVLLGDSSRAMSQAIVVVALLTKEKALTAPSASDLRQIVRETGAGHVALMTTTPKATEPAILQSLLDIRSSGAEILLFDWTDVTMGIAAKAIESDPQHALHRARAHLLETLNTDERGTMGEKKRADWLADRALPRLRFVLEHLAGGSRVFDLGCGFGRHTFAALAAGHTVLAVERKPDACESIRAAAREIDLAEGRLEIVQGDFGEAGADKNGVADLVIATGVLQHAKDMPELERRLATIASLAATPGAIAYIEMLFDMLFDGRPPADGRIKISQAEFEAVLRHVFPAPAWSIQLSFGPLRQRQSFPPAGRSFQPPAALIESTTVEYRIDRLD
jgi:energy-coupling factor transport system substrate-specific component